MKKEFTLMILILMISGCVGTHDTNILYQQQSAIQHDQKKDMLIVDLNDGDTYDLSADIITKDIAGNMVTMYGYNGRTPGPLLKVNQNSTITINFKNNIDMPTTVHWHGLRHDNKDDGVPNITQKEILPGESFTYQVYFPDAGVFWYHPHVREDMQQELGLAGNMYSFPENGFAAEVNREEFLILDDILMQNGKIAPFYENYADHALMGRFGNVMLMNGETDYQILAKKGEVVRFFVTNIANVRPYNLSFAGAKMKLIGSDLGLYEHEEFVDSVTILPAERYIIDVLFDQEGTVQIQNANPVHTYRLGEVKVSGSISDSKEDDFKKIHTDQEVIKDINKFRPLFDKPVDHTIDLTLKMNMMSGMMGSDDMMSSGHMGRSAATMPGNGPQMMMRDHEQGSIEWEDTMAMMNSASTSKSVTWILRENQTKKENMDMVLKAKVGDVLKIRLFNDPNSIHPMQHPIHLHGQRFLVLSTDGNKTDNLVWKDTVAVPSGSTVDILVDVTNPGKWMLHCHIAEHLTAGMMSMLEVEE